VTWSAHLYDGMLRMLRWLVVVALVGLTAVMVVQIVLRYLLQSSFVGVEEISTLFGLWLYYAGLALVTAQGEHIGGGLVAGLLSPRSRRNLDRVFALLCGAICAYFCVLALQYAVFIGGNDRRSTFLRWPSVIWAASLCFGLGLSTLLFFLRALRPQVAARRAMAPEGGA
jgi:TRAP-type C4-dicarboxylate transport system permease small subunit